MQVTEIWEFSCTSTLEETTTNVATATGEDKLGQKVTDTDDATVEVLKPGIKVVKKADKTEIRSGDEVKYTYTVTNTGNTPLLNVEVTDDKCSPVTYKSGDDNSDSKMQTTETWTYTCTQALTDTTTNVATATGEDSLEQRVKDTDNETVTVLKAWLQLNKQVEGKGDPNDWTLTAEVVDNDKAPKVKNLGGQGELTEVWSEIEYKLNETGPGGYSPSDWVCLPAKEDMVPSNYDEALNVKDKITLRTDAKVVCTIVNTRDLGSLTITKSFDPKTSGYDKAFDIGYKCENEAQGTVSLKAGQSETINGIPTGTECQVTEVKPTDPPAGWSFSDPVYDPADGKVKVTEKNQTVSVTVTNEILKPGINIVKTGSSTQVNPGQTVTYTYTVTNPGDTPLTDVKVTDDRCAPVVYKSGDTDGDTKLQPTETWTFTCSQQITVATTNVGTVTGKDKNGTTVTAQDTFTVAVVSPVVNKKICPIKVTLVKPKPKKVGNRVLVKKIKTKKSSCKILKPVVLCRPLATTAAGEKAFCDTKVTKRGKIRVKTRGYDKVKVTVIVRSKPKKGFEDRYKPNTWRKSWILR